MNKKFPPLRSRNWFQWNDKIFYKEDHFPDELWINNEVLVQLNVTAKCPLNCEFCYIKQKYGNEDLSFYKILKLWNNLKKYYDEYGITYRVNITGGDIFYYPELEKLLYFLKDNDSVTAVDPLLNTFWNEEHKRLLNIVIDKITYIEFNVLLVKDSDIEYAYDNTKWVVLKYPLYKGNTKKMLYKVVNLMKKWENVILAFDWIIPQSKEFVEYTYIKDIKGGVEEAKRVIEILEREGLKDRVLPLFCIVEREVFGRTYLCGVGIQNIYVMPDGKIVPCSRYPWLDTGFTIDNFDLFEYFSKFNKLISNTCLFENKYFEDYWSKDENPRDW